MGDYTFRIVDAFTAATMPMARLAEYMAELAKLIGEPEHVHFERVTDGSVKLVAVVDMPVEEPVRERLAGIRDRNGPPEALRAAERLDEMLAKDQASGQLLGEDGAEIIPFPGKNRAAAIVYGQFREDGTLEGEIVRIGGTKDDKNITLRDGQSTYSECVATTDIARQLLQYMWGPTVRLHGTGTWQRHEDGEWELKSFRVKSVEALDDVPLDDLVRQLRSIPGNRWDEESDPVKTILDERGSRGDQH